MERALVVKVKKNTKSAERKKSLKLDQEGDVKEESLTSPSNVSLNSPSFFPSSPTRGEADPNLHKVEQRLKKATKTAQLLREQVKKLGVKIQSSVSNQEQKDKVLQDFIKLFELREKDYEAGIEDNGKYRALKEQWILMDKAIAKKSEELETAQREISSLRNKIGHLDSELEKAKSPKKDRVLQLENRLDVIQSSAKSQQKRLEDELNSVRKYLIDASQEVQQLQGKASLADELLVANQKLRHEFESIQNNATTDELQQTIYLLEQQKKQMELENAEERAGLVNELIDTKDKLKECTKTISMNRSSLDRVQSLENQLQCVTAQLDEARALSKDHQLLPQSGETGDAIDKLFPSLDPALRHFVRLLSQNQNYLYGVFGIFIYILILHLYVLL